MLFQGHELKVGQRLWSMIYGWVIVTDIRFADGRYSIICMDRSKNYATFTSDGKYYHEFFNDPQPTLYWNKPVFDIPQPPIKKYQWLVRKKGVHKNWNITREKYETFADIILIASSAEIKYEDYEFKRVED